MRDTEVTKDLIYDSIEKHVTEKPAFQSDCLYELKDNVKFHRERLEEWNRKHPQATKNEQCSHSNFWESILRMVGALTIPYVVLAVIIAVGDFSARRSTPWHDGSDGYPDGLTLISASLIGGIAFSLSSHGIAKKWRKVIATTTVLLFIVWSIAAMLLVPESTNGFGVFRLCVTILGMVIGCVIAWEKDNYDTAKE